MDETSQKINSALLFISIFICWVAGYIFKIFVYGYYGQDTFFYGTAIILYILVSLFIHPAIHLYNKYNNPLPLLPFVFTIALLFSIIFSLIYTFIGTDIEGYKFTISYGLVCGGVFSLSYRLISKNKNIIKYYQSRYNQIRYLYISPIVFILLISFVIWPITSQFLPGIVCYVGNQASRLVAKKNYLKSLKVGDDIGYSLTYKNCMNGNRKDSIFSKSLYVKTINMGHLGDSCSRDAGICLSYDIDINNGVIRELFIEVKSFK